jgi:DNA-binding transcriptional LysR family regulator
MQRRKSHDDMTRAATSKTNEYQRIRLLLQRHLRIRHLILLTTIAQQGSLLKAASFLNITQSATTRALSELESSLTIKLFLRSSRGVTPTAFGQVLINHAEAILGEIRYTADELTELEAGSGGHIVIGVLRAAAPALLPQALVQFRAQHPRVTITVIEGTFPVLSPAVRAGEIDFIVGYLPEVGPRQGLTQERLYFDAVAIVVRRSHPILRLKKKRLTLADLADQSWVLPLRDTVLRRRIDAEFRAADLEAPIACIESVTTSLLQSLLAQTNMVVVLPYQVAEQFKKLGLVSILPIKLSSTGLPVGITMRSDYLQKPAVKALVEIMRSVAQNTGISSRHRAVTIS